MTAYSQRAITQDGLERLEKDLERLSQRGAPEPGRATPISTRDPGDPGDNLEFLEAQQDLAMLEGRIAELEVAIANAWVQEAPSDGTIGVGSKIVVRDSDGEEDHYTLVGSAEANPRGGLISVESPVGRALAAGPEGRQGPGGNAVRPPRDRGARGQVALGRSIRLERPQGLPSLRSSLSPASRPLARAAWLSRAAPRGTRTAPPRAGMPGSPSSGRIIRRQARR